MSISVQENELSNGVSQVLFV